MQGSINKVSYDAALIVTNLDSAPHTSPHWNPHTHICMVKLNCDVAFKNSKAHIGIVVRDFTVFHATTQEFYGHPCCAMSPLQLDIDLHFACSHAYDNKRFGAIVESDSQIVISLSSS
ncbi:hypothetical protein Tco_1068429 [Tanacetum coccineum]|uniref:RNase H type-1 domain-containing protein n=1 Tax=Tanacetum coccineum TaxID=301880 RepID=A0ABQ5HHG6_9ASTR